MVYIWVWIETEIYPYRGAGLSMMVTTFDKRMVVTKELKNLMTVMMIMTMRSPITVGAEG